MSIRHLDDFFDPASVAVIGASTRPGSVGATVWHNLRHGRFTGPVWAVNKNHPTVGGDLAFASVADLPAAPALAVICTPAASVTGLIRQLGARGTRAAVVLSAGFTSRQKQSMLNAAKKHLLRIVGPNCMGLLSPAVGINASFSHADIGAGSLAFVSQSGALVAAMLDWARGRGIGFSRMLSLGEHADVDFGDMLDWLASDPQTRAVLLYVESISDARKFMSAARACARNKPVLVVKAGRSSAGQRAAASHTGALAASDDVIDAALRRAGMLRVDSLQELFIAAETLAYFGTSARGTDRAAAERLMLVTNGGGAGVLAADAAAALGIELAPLSEATCAALDAGLPGIWSQANPVDIIGDAPVERYVHTLGTLLAQPDAGTLLFMHAPTAIVPATDIARALVPLAQAHPGRLISAWLGDGAVAEARRLFHVAGIPTYDTPEQAVHAMAMLATYRRNQEQLTEAPPAHTARSLKAAAFDLEAVRVLVNQTLDSGRELMTEAEAKSLLAACGIPVVPARVVAPTPQAAADAATELGLPAVIKIVSPQISHKSDVGGVALNLDSADQVYVAADKMLQRVRSLRPEAQIEGFSVQSMVRRPRAIELIAGTSVDAVLGPVILFGAGGVSVEVVADSALALPPLNVPLARALVQRTRVAKLMKGYRDVPAVNETAVLDTLIALSQLLADEPRIAEIDINPLLADASGVVALDARVRVSAQAPGGAARFAIRPYPAELVQTLDWQGRSLTLRPIRPEDEAQHLRFLEQLDPQDIRLRVFYSRRTIERSELARLTQIDYAREMAFIATAADAAGSEETLGVVRATCDPDNIEAEFGIVVRSDLKGGGLGVMLMNKMVDHLRKHGTQRLVGTVLRENQRMLDLAHELGFALNPDTNAIGSADTVQVHLAMNPG